MTYKVIKGFLDLQDRNRAYRIGDDYPASGIETTEARIQELLSSHNKLGEPLIAKVEESKVEEPKEEPKAEEKEEPKEEPKAEKPKAKKKKKE